MKMNNRGAQGPMSQNRPKGDTLAKERAAHEACESHSYEGKNTLPKPTKQGSQMETEKLGGY